MDKISNAEGETTGSVVPVLVVAKSDFHMQEKGKSEFAA